MEWRVDLSVDGWRRKAGSFEDWWMDGWMACWSLEFGPVVGGIGLVSVDNSRDDHGHAHGSRRSELTII